MDKRIEITLRFDKVLKEISKLIDELRVKTRKDELIIRVSIMELVGVGEIMKDRKIKKYSIKMEIPIFYGVIGEDPKEWTNQVGKYLSKIGIKDDKRIFEIAKTHLLGNALKWLENEGICVADWDKNEIKELRLKYRLIEKYSDNKS
ncbi:hypothetical protein RhiirA4_490196 [Rhizophagus irregularis]|uniref:Uncharacterized protein n=1 Tax=Rhizophagus irregularis TaxID=588596 RepID=A0A2I1HVI9_9GLOM|nr:hypothetical protein RhiirA4_490196 [Rhizophagus irregularis]